MSNQNSQKAPPAPSHPMYYPYYQMGTCCPHYPCYPVPSFEEYQAFIKKYEKEKQLSQQAKGETAKQIDKQVVKVEQSDFPKTEAKLDDKGLSCQCAKSNCLKEYCYCFKNGFACGQKCGCSSCKNDQDQLNEKRHPRKKKKVTCKCSKSQCMKKYCECYTAQKKCDDTCGCTGCQN